MSDVLNSLKNPNNKTIKSILRSFAHMFGIYSDSDYVRLGRKVYKSRGLRKILLEVKYIQLGSKLRIEIPSKTYKNIGDNFQLVHASSVVIHEDAVIGNSCTVYKGVSIGSVRNGKRKGVPIIQDRVCIHANSVVAGGITIGHDSLIAACTFVDFDVPPHSVVIGSPGVIHHKEYASKDYIKE